MNGTLNLTDATPIVFKYVAVRKTRGVLDTRYFLGTDNNITKDVEKVKLFDSEKDAKEYIDYFFTSENHKEDWEIVHTRVW